MREFEATKKFHKLSDIPGISEEGVNVDCGFRVGVMNSDEAIVALTHINGISISELEERMRPNQFEGMGFGMYSYDGFLGDNESLIEVLLKANRIVKENGYTHQQLADWMELAINAWQNQEGKFEYYGMKFKVSYMGTVSAGQESPFRNSKVEQDPETQDWDGEYEIRNLTTGRWIKFTPPLPHWVRNWGFYEGFETPYHVSPQGLIDLFTKRNRIYETRKELANRLEREYRSQGWKKVVIDHPDVFLDEYFDYAFVVAALTRYNDDLEGAEKITQLLEDEHFIVGTLGYYDYFVRFDKRIVIFSQANRKKPLVLCPDVAKYEITRFAEKGRVIVSVRMIQRGRKDYQRGEIIVNSVPGKNGWLVEESGELQQVVDFEYLFGFGSVTADSDDLFRLYKNSRIEFLTQKRGEAVWFLYKKDKKTGIAERIFLNPEALIKRIGVGKVAENDFVSEVKNVSVTEDGVVKGILVIKGREIAFSL